MGLDIVLHSDNYDEISELKEFREIERNCNLSREFCNLMCRKNVLESGVTELEQISLITDCDISFLYQMENYTPEWELNDLMDFEDEQTIESLKKANLEVENNIDKVISGLKCLISQLNGIANLEAKIVSTDYDTIGI